MMKTPPPRIGPYVPMTFSRCEMTGQLFAEGDDRDYWINHNSQLFAVEVMKDGKEDRRVGVYETEAEAIEFANWHNRCKL